MSLAFEQQLSLSCPMSIMAEPLRTARRLAGLGLAGLGVAGLLALADRMVVGIGIFTILYCRQLRWDLPLQISVVGGNRWREALTAVAGDSLVVCNRRVLRLPTHVVQ